jgi:hypothetical protein
MSTRHNQGTPSSMLVVGGSTRCGIFLLPVLLSPQDPLFAAVWGKRTLCLRPACVAVFVQFLVCFQARVCAALGSPARRAMLLVRLRPLCSQGQSEGCLQEWLPVMQVVGVHHGLWWPAQALACRSMTCEGSTPSCTEMHMSGDGTRKELMSLHSGEWTSSHEIAGTMLGVVMAAVQLRT